MRSEALDNRRSVSRSRPARARSSAAQAAHPIFRAADPASGGTDVGQTSTVDIRERREVDLDELVAIAAAVQRVDSYPRFVASGDLARFLTRPKSSMAWVAVQDHRVLGHVALHDTTTPPVMQLVADCGPQPPAIYVARLLVDPSARRAGVGRDLLEHARRAAIEVARSPFVDVVETPSAVAAISLYRRCGWSEIGRVRVDLAGNDAHELVFRGPLT